MRRNRVELEALHAALAGAFRELPDASSTAALKYAADKAGCSAAVARRALEFGLGKGLRSIRDLLGEERLLARSALRRENIASLVSEATEDARADAVESRKRAGRL